MKKDYQVMLDLYHNELPAIVNVETGELTIIEDINSLEEITASMQELLYEEVASIEISRLVTKK
jgi:hypothetical protein